MRTPIAVLILSLACACKPAPADESGTLEAGASETFAATFGSESESGPSSGGEDLPSTPDPDLPSGGDDCDALAQLVEQLQASPQLEPQLVDEFVMQISYGARGFPIVEGQRLCALYLGEPAQSLTITGDFNAWDAEQYPLAFVSDTLAWADIALPSPPSGLYKFVREGSDYIADPLARRFGWDDFGEYSQFDALPERSHHERWPGFAQGVGLLAPRTITVWLPPGAFTGGELPVLYMHDGQNLFAPDALWGGWQVGPQLDEALANAWLEPLLVVGIDNTPARMDEYTQVGDVIDGTPMGGRADEYAAFVVDGVKPFIESRYPAASAPESVALMGSSLGGLVSLYIGLRHPEVFGSVASMSGTIAWGTIGASNPTIIDAYIDAPPLGLRIYLDSGGDPGLGCPDDGSDNYCGNVEFADMLRSFGWVDEADLVYRWDPGAPHNEAAWAARLIPALVDWF